MHKRSQIHHLSRTIISLVVLLSIGTLFIPISHPVLVVADILLRTYLIFLGTVMAHESVHGHLGRTKAANFWWGRIALLPSMVPFTNFRKTHRLHHAHTNIPELDPDHFMKAHGFFGLFLRSLAITTPLVLLATQTGSAQTPRYRRVSAQLCRYLCCLRHSSLLHWRDQIVLGHGPAAGSRFTLALVSVCRTDARRLLNRNDAPALT